MVEAAFFDLDKTVIARSSTLAFGRPLFREGMIGRAQVIKGAYATVVYNLFGADEAKMEKMRQALLELTEGWDKARIESLVRETLQEIVDPIIFAEALDLITMHRNEGRRVYLISSSPEEIVRPLADYLGVEHAIGTRARVDADGRYTGELEFYAYGEGKREAIKREASNAGIDLAESYAYSDSITDLPMLESVGHPHAVNPDRELRKVAEERQWPIMWFANPVSLRRRVAARVETVPRPSPTAAALATVAALAVLAWLFLRRVRTIAEDS